MENHRGDEQEYLSALSEEIQTVGDAAETAKEIDAECRRLAEMLMKKNRAYGNSALDPVRVFSKANPVEQLLVRIDDKLSRIKRGRGDEQEDVIQDLMGYLILLRIARRRGAPEATSTESSAAEGTGGEQDA